MWTGKKVGTLFCKEEKTGILFSLILYHSLLFSLLTSPQLPLLILLLSPYFLFYFLSLSLLTLLLFHGTFTTFLPYFTYIPSLISPTYIPPFLLFPHLLFLLFHLTPIFLLSLSSYLLLSRPYFLSPSPSHPLSINAQPHNFSSLHLITPFIYSHFPPFHSLSFSHFTLSLTSPTHAFSYSPSFLYFSTLIFPTSHPFISPYFSYFVSSRFLSVLHILLTFPLQISP